MNQPVGPTDHSQHSPNPYSTFVSPEADLQLPQQTKHSRVGICSFVGAIISGLISLALFGSIAFLAIWNPAPLEGNNAAVYMAVGLMSFAVIAVSVLSIGLGIASLFQKDRRRVLGILGLIFSTAIVLTIGGLMLLGSVV